MTELPKRMIECSAVARAVQAHAASLLSGQCGNWREHYHKSPDLITEEQL